MRQHFFFFLIDFELHYKTNKVKDNSCDLHNVRTIHHMKITCANYILTIEPNFVCFHYGEFMQIILVVVFENLLFSCYLFSFLYYFHVEDEIYVPKWKKQVTLEAEIHWDPGEHSLKTDNLIFCLQ